MTNNPDECASLRLANIARDKEWDTGKQISLSFRGNELAGEVGEACNILKKLDREAMGLVGSRATKEQLLEEIADIIICIDLIGMHLDISSEQIYKAVADKFNKTSDQRGHKTRLVLP